MTDVVARRADQASRYLRDLLSSLFISLDIPEFAVNVVRLPIRLGARTVSMSEIEVSQRQRVAILTMKRPDHGNRITQKWQ
jgi:hypothetical protein